MCLQPFDKRWNDARDVLAPRTGNYADSFDHFGFCRSASKANSTLASAAQFHFHDF
jgi:hypothetical protein